MVIPPSFARILTGRPSPPCERTVQEESLPRSLFSLPLDINAKQEAVDSPDPCFVSLKRRICFQKGFAGRLTDAQGDSSNQSSQSSWKLTLDRLDTPNFEADVATYASLLRLCGNAKALWDGKHVHYHMVTGGHERNEVLSSFLIQMYVSCKALEDARALFCSMHHQNVFTWNFLFKAYSHEGRCWQALQLLEQMQRAEVMPNKVTFLSILNACAGKATHDEIKKLHALIQDNRFESDVVVGTSLVNLYGKCGSLKEALGIFNKISERDVVAWTSMLSVYIQHGCGKEALQCFEQMKEEGVVPNKVTFITALASCDKHAVLPRGKWVHSHILENGLETDVVVGTSLINMYGKCGSLEDAKRMFLKMTNRNVVSWNTIIGVYAQHGHRKEALQLFDHMQCEGPLPNKETCITILAACASPEALSEGEQMHARILDNGFEPDISVGNALVNMYGKCGSTKDAQKMFNIMHDRNVVSWTAMISVYAQNGQYQEALHMFNKMLSEGFVPNKVTIVSILAACTSQAMLSEGKWILAYVFDNGFESDLAIGNVLVHAYGRYGGMEDA